MVETQVSFVEIWDKAEQTLTWRGGTVPFESVISQPHSNIYQLVDIIKEEQALTEELSRWKRKYIAVHEHLTRLKKGYVDCKKLLTNLCLV